MTTENLLGKNIRSLRNLYGESQEELGDVIHHSKTAISNYEKDIRYPDPETISLLAKHFYISEDDLLKEDYSDMENMNIRKEVFWENLATILPIFSSEDALKDIHFRWAYKNHRFFYSSLPDFDSDSFDKVMDDGFTGYLYSFYDKEGLGKYESAANILSSLFLLVFISKAPRIIVKEPAPIKRLAKNDAKVKMMINDIKATYTDKDLEEIESELSDPWIMELFHDTVYLLKRSPQWSDLADYYLALLYLFDLNHHDRGWVYNRDIGLTMISTFAFMDNPYAKNLTQIIKKIVRESSQSVNTK